MTVDELRTEANKLGYNLVKKQVYTKLVRCTCGCKPSQVMVWNGRKFIGYSHVCKTCGNQSAPHKLKYKAKLNWNEMINGGNANVD